MTKSELTKIIKEELEKQLAQESAGRSPADITGVDFDSFVNAAELLGSMAVDYRQQNKNPDGPVRLAQKLVEDAKKIQAFFERRKAAILKRQ